MHNPLRVLTIGHSYTIAMNRALVRRVAELDDFEMTVAAPRFFHGDLRPITLDPEPPGSKLRVVGLGARWTNWIHGFHYDWSELESLASDGDFDVVHAWQEPYIFAGYQVGRIFARKRAKFMFRTAQNLVKSYPPPFHQFERSTLARADAWVAGGHLVYDAMIRRGYAAAKGQVITLAVDVSAFQPATSEEKSRLVRELGITPPVIAFTGRLTAAKGVSILREALDRLPSDLQWSLLVLGSGPEEQNLRRWAAERHPNRRIHIGLARHEDMPRTLAAADIMVAPSQTMPNWREQFGRMTIEAFASGVATIGSDSGEIPSVIGDAGLVVPEKDVAGWSNAIQLLLQDRMLRQTLVTRGLKRVSVYSVPEVAGRYATLYRSLGNQARESQAHYSLRTAVR
jgi:glycosyltransferase involved in cell wall biosynthesis